MGTHSSKWLAENHAEELIDAFNKKKREDIQKYFGNPVTKFFADDTVQYFKDMARKRAALDKQAALGRSASKLRFALQSVPVAEALAAERKHKRVPISFEDLFAIEAGEDVTSSYKRTKPSNLVPEWVYKSALRSVQNKVPKVDEQVQLVHLTKEADKELKDLYLSDTARNRNISDEQKAWLKKSAYANIIAKHHLSETAKKDKIREKYGKEIDEEYKTLLRKAQDKEDASLWEKAQWRMYYDAKRAILANPLANRDKVEFAYEAPKNSNFYKAQKIHDRHVRRQKAIKAKWDASAAGKLNKIKQSLVAQKLAERNKEAARRKAGLERQRAFEKERRAKNPARIPYREHGNIKYKKVHIKSRSKPAQRGAVMVQHWDSGYNDWKRLNIIQQKKRGVRHSIQGGWQKSLGADWDKLNKAQMKRIKLPNGRWANIVDSQLGVPLGYDGPSDTQFDNKGVSSMDYVEEAFGGKWTVHERKGRGHILYLKYSQRFQLLCVTFWNGAEVVYFRVPPSVVGELFFLADNDVKTTNTFDGSERHELGVTFWNIVRIRGTLHGSRYRFQYVKEGTSGTGPYGYDVGRPTGTGKYNWTDVPVTRYDPDTKEFYTASYKKKAAVQKDTMQQMAAYFTGDDFLKDKQTASPLRRHALETAYDLYRQFADGTLKEDLRDPDNPSTQLESLTPDTIKYLYDMTRDEKTFNDYITKRKAVLDAVKSARSLAKQEIATNGKHKLNMDAVLSLLDAYKHDKVI